MKPWLVWKHDPCPEGGWHVHGEYYTKDEAIEAAKKVDTEEEEAFQRMVEFCKNPESGPPEEWPRSNQCYDGCMVTSNEVFRIKWNREQVQSSES